MNVMMSVFILPVRIGMAQIQLAVVEIIHNEHFMLISVAADRFTDVPNVTTRFF